MKKMNKLLSLVLVLAIALSLAIPAMAASTHTVTINGNTEGHIYEAYQIFNGDYEAGVLTNIVWGDGVDGDALLAELKSTDVTVSNSDETITVEFKELFKNCADAADVADVITSKTQPGGEWASKGDRAEAFAEIVAKHLKAANAKTAVASGKTYTFTGLDDGYYLIKDQNGSLAGETDEAYTDFILAVVGDVTVSPKGGIPVLTKEVAKGLNEEYEKLLDTEVGRTVYYELTAKIPVEYDEYHEYYLEFVDTMSAGLTFNRIEQIYVSNQSAAHNVIYDANTTPATEKTDLMPAITEPTGTDGGVLSVKWENLKALEAKGLYLQTGEFVCVKFSATLNENAVVGNAGNLNTAELIYSNNPNSNDHGKTLPEYAVVYTFTMNMSKVITGQNSDTSTLDNAQFVIYHKHDDNSKYYAVIENNTLKRWTTNESEATVLVSKKGEVMTVKGLMGDMTYYLHEKAAPSGYNKLFTDIELDLIPVYDNEPLDITNGNLTELKYDIDSENFTSEDDATVKVMVENSAGAMLPETGGIGTTIFYLLGSTLALGAVILLITKKRMSA